MSVFPHIVLAFMFGLGAGDFVAQNVGEGKRLDSVISGALVAFPTMYLYFLVAQALS